MTMPSDITADDLRGVLVRLEPYTDIAGLAEYFKVSERWVEDRIREGGIPRHRIARRWKFRCSEVEGWLREHGHIEDEGEAA